MRSVPPKPRSTLPFVRRATAHRGRVAIRAADGDVTYAELLDRSARVAAALSGETGDLRQARVAFVVPPSAAYAATLWGIWRAGGVAVPLATSHPPPEWEYAIADSRAAVVAGHPDVRATLEPLAGRLGIPYVDVTDALEHGAAPLPPVSAGRRAMIVYTSGTTGRPKGVVTTHENIDAQVTSLLAAWEWTADDRILLVLPLHHVHGIINVLSCALWAGACCEILPAFDAGETWDRIASGRLTLFMAVPTIYHKLIAAWDRADPAAREAMAGGCRRVRLMVSGSAALPAATFERWRTMTGHELLERYGMTEIGMGLANPLAGPRVPGHVGEPLPGVEIKLVGDGGGIAPGGTPGEIHVRGPGVFVEYWGRPDETRLALRDGWFATGDAAVLEEGGYRLLGRQSVDIIKTGGYKVSALEIEEVLRTHPAIAECAVVGVPDAEWGERVCVAVEAIPGQEIGLEGLQTWTRERLAPYKSPRELVVVRALPRNAMGKVIKPAVATLFHTSTPGGGS